MGMSGPNKNTQTLSKSKSKSLLNSYYYKPASLLKTPGDLREHFLKIPEGIIFKIPPKLAGVARPFLFAYIDMRCN